MDETERPPVLRAISNLEQLRAFGKSPHLPNFAAPKGNKGQCLLIIGEIGTGKTTLLRAIALALTEPTVVSALLDARAPVLRDGADGRVTVALEQGTCSVRLHQTAGVEATTIEEAPEGLRPRVLGYGVRRGNALGERDRAPEVGPVGDLHTLFDGPNAMYRAHDWLSDLGTRANLEAPRGGGANGPRQQRWASVRRAVCRLLNLESLTVDDDGQVWFASATVGQVRRDLRRERDARLRALRGGDPRAMTCAVADLRLRCSRGAPDAGMCRWVAEQALGRPWEELPGMPP